jgi:hypothetical protein
MRIGVVYPERLVSGDPDNLRKFIRALEDFGYDHMHDMWSQRDGIVASRRRAATMRREPVSA